MCHLYVLHTFIKFQQPRGNNEKVTGNITPITTFIDFPEQL